MLQLKVCGMTQQENVQQLAKLKPDYVGLIFHEKSPRNIAFENTIQVPENMRKVGVFVNETEGFILDRIEQFNFKYVQLHGNESPHFCKKVKQLNRKIIKAFNIHEGFDFSQLSAYEPYCDYFLFDALGENAGGNGIQFNWTLLSNYKGETPFFLSGGITPGTVKKLKEFEHPRFAGVDINSGFETTPGIKDVAKIKQFRNELYS